MSEDTQIMPAQPSPLAAPSRPDGRTRAILVTIAATLSITVLLVAAYLFVLKLTSLVAGILALMILVAVGVPVDPATYG